MSRAFFGRSQRSGSVRWLTLLFRTVLTVGKETFNRERLQRSLLCAVPRDSEERYIDDVSFALSPHSLFFIEGVS